MGSNQRQPAKRQRSLKMKFLKREEKREEEDRKETLSRKKQFREQRREKMGWRKKRFSSIAGPSVEECVEGCISASAWSEVSHKHSWESLPKKQQVWEQLLDRMSSIRVYIKRLLDKMCHVNPRAYDIIILLLQVHTLFPIYIMQIDNYLWQYIVNLFVFFQKIRKNHSVITGFCNDFPWGKFAVGMVWVWTCFLEVLRKRKKIHPNRLSFSKSFHCWRSDFKYKSIFLFFIIYVGWYFHIAME